MSASNSAESRVSSLYNGVITEVIRNCKEFFLNDSVDESILTELRTIWEQRLEATRAVEASGAPPGHGKEQYGTTQFQPHLAQSTLPAATSVISNTGGQPTVVGTFQGTVSRQAMRPMLVPSQQPAFMAPPRAVITARLPTSSRPPQLDGAVEEPACSVSHEANLAETEEDSRCSAAAVTVSVDAKGYLRAKKRRKHGVPQLDGAHGSSDEEDDDEVEEEEEEEDDDEEDIDGGEPIYGEDGEGEGSHHEDGSSLGSGDDTSSQGSVVFETENVVVCQFDKVGRSRNRWKFSLKDGIMNLNGRDFVFHKATGEAEW